MTARNEPARLSTRIVLLDDGTQLEAPFDRTCGACQSPWAPQIDSKLADGISPAAILEDLGNKRPKCPNTTIIRAHIAHLPEIHRKMRLLLEDPGRTQVGVGEALNEIIQRGWEQLADGNMELTGADWLRAMALRAKLDAASAELATSEEWRAAFLAFFDTLKHYLKPAEWQAFMAECYASPEIQAVSPRAGLAASPRARSEVT